MNVTVDQTAEITVESAQSAEQLREVFGPEYQGPRLVLTARFEGRWRSRGEMEDTFNECVAQLRAAVDENL